MAEAAARGPKSTYIARAWRLVVALAARALSVAAHGLSLAGEVTFSRAASAIAWRGVTVGDAEKAPVGPATFTASPDVDDRTHAAASMAVGRGVVASSRGDLRASRP